MFTSGRRGFMKGAALGGVASLVSLGGGAAVASPAIRHPYRADPAAGLAEVPAISASSGTEGYWTEVRSHFGLADDYIHMNTGTTGSLPLFAQQNLAVMNAYKAADPLNWAKQLATDFPDVFRPNEKGDAVATRQAEIAAMYGANADEIMLTYNTTDGCGIVFTGIPWKQGDRIIVTSMEHAGMMGSVTWAQTFHGVDVVTIPLASMTTSALTVAEMVETFAQELDKPLPAGAKQYVAFSEIPYKNGLRLPVREICAAARQRGAFSIVDSAHGWGQLPVNCHEYQADFIAGAGHKWLSGGPGTGILYVRNSGDNLPAFGFPSRYQAKFAGNRDWAPATVMQGRGEYNRPALIAMGDVARFYDGIGTEAIYARCVELGDYLKDRIAERWGEQSLWVQKNADPTFATGLTCFNPFAMREDAAEYDAMKTAFGQILDKLMTASAKKIYIRTSDWRDASSDPLSSGNDRIGLRISTHGVYNSREDVDLLFDSIVKHIDATGISQV